jgi:hypothetical protein
MVPDSVGVDSIKYLLGRPGIGDFKDKLPENGQNAMPGAVPEGIRFAPDSLDGVIDYSAKDSMVMDMRTKTLYLYSSTKVTYEKITVEGPMTEYNWERSEAWARGELEKKGTLGGKITFTESDKIYLADDVRYNFKSKKGKSSGLITKEQEGWLHGEQIKSFGENVLYGRNARYTTCEYDHPHYYFEVGKAKIINDKLIVGKPANLIIEDVRTPLVLPFGLFPLTKQRTSGIVFPRYGQSAELGFFLNDGGYYWGNSDKMDLMVTGDIYTRGTWGLDVGYNFKKLYKVSGNINVGLSQFKTDNRVRADPGFTPAPFDFFISSGINLDPKRLYNSNFSSSIYAGTRTYQKFNVSDQQTFLANTYRSSMSYSKWWPGKPFRLSMSGSHSQQTDTRRINISLPVVNLSMSRITPFERKVPTGGRKWYENIGITYSFEAQNRLNTFDSLLKRKETWREMDNGIVQRANVGTSVRILKYINFTPNFNFNERWYFKYAEKTFVADSVVNNQGDTVLVYRVKDLSKNGFKAAHDFDLNASLSARWYGTFQFKRAKKVKAIRHVVSPSISFNYRPDFGKERWGYYRTVQSDTFGNIQRYSIFQNAIYGGPPDGDIGGIGFSLSNNIEMKVASKKDTITGTRKIKLLESFNLSTFYNFAADSLNLSPLSFNGFTKIVDPLRVSFSGSLDPYYTDPQTGRRVNRFNVKEIGRLYRLTNFQLSLNGQYTAKSSFKGNTEDMESIRMQQPSGLMAVDNVFGGVVGQVDYSNPWTVRYDYNLSIARTVRGGKDTTIINQSINISTDFSLTPKWKISVSSGFDVTNKKINRTDISIYRDLHCWQMAVRWIPLGFQRSISVDINLKAAMLRDLRLSKTKNWFDYN